MNEFLDKLFPEEPTDIGELTPLKELSYDLKHLKKHMLWYIPLSIILSAFISGLLYQLFMNVIRGDVIYLFSSFKYGFTYMIPLTLILVFIFCFGAFKGYRSLKKTYLMNYKDNYMKSKRETYGGAHFQDDDEIAENFEIYDSIEETTGEIFGIKDDKYLVFKMKPGLNYNEAFFGAPGCGKTSSTIKTKMYQAIRRGDSLVCTDTKGDLYSETSAVARKHGYKVKVLNLKPSEFKNSDAFNIFETLDRNDPSLDTKADIIANIIINNTSASPKDTQDYWAKNEFVLLKAVIMYVASDEAKIKLHLNTLPEVFNVLSKNTSASLASIFSTYAPDSPVRQCYNIFAACEERNQGQIINGAAIRLAKITNEHLQKVLSNSDINFTEPMQKKCLYYVIIDDMDDSYRFLSSLFFSCMFHEQCLYSDKLSKEEKKKQKRVYYLLDEYYASGGIYGISQKISTLRSRKIGLTIILQNKSQLDAMYDENDTATILNACVVKGLLSTNDQITADYFSYLLGTQTIVGQADRYEESSADFFHAHPSVNKTMTEGQRPLMLPEELMNGKLPIDEIIYVISTEPPVKIKKCYAELAGERLHPLEIEGGELGERKPHRHKPQWRKLEEEAEAKRQEESANCELPPKEEIKEQKPETPLPSSPKEEKPRKKTKYVVYDETPSEEVINTVPEVHEQTIDTESQDKEQAPDRELTFSEMWDDKGIFD